MPHGRTMYGRALRSAAATQSNSSRVHVPDSFYSSTVHITCPYCGRQAKSEVGRDRHVNLSPPCRARHKYLLKCQRELKRKEEPDTDAPLPESAHEPPRKRTRIEVEDPPVAGPSRLPFPNNRPNTPTAGDANGGGGSGYYSNGLFIEPFPVRTAGTPVGTQHRSEEDLREYRKACGRLGDRDLFETAEILTSTGLTGVARTQHLNGPINGNGVWRNNAELMKEVDGLRKGPSWTTVEVEVGEGIYQRTHTVHLRNLLDVIRELIGARRFKHCMRYAPERHWTSRDKTCRVYDEMWSGNWWWRMQHLIHNDSGTVVPLIFASDETTLTNNAHGPKGHPIYMSIGNISKSIRRRPTKHAMVVVGYIPVDTFEEVANKATGRRYRNELLHQSLEKIFEPLKTASSEGILAWCADGCVRHIYPIVAAWSADWPEQNNLACTTQGGCPKCMHEWKGRSQGGPSAPLRDPKASLAAIRAYLQTKRAAELEPLRLLPCLPFWADIPHVDIGACMAPDLLHQLYKGMFEHIRDWVELLLGTKEFNNRFKAMPTAQDLRHFKNGVTTVKVWAGRESRDMMRQFLPIAIDAQAPEDLIRMIHALLDFSYLAHGAQLSDKELTEMDDALAAFHDAKYVLVKEKIIKNASQFDRAPKIHMLGHYTDDIRELGVPDGYSTETPEHLHIVYVKIPWRMSSRRDPFPQIVQYIRRLEAIRMQRTIIDEFYGEREGADEEEIRRYAEAQREAEGVVEEADSEDSEGSEDGELDGGDDVEVEGEKEPTISAITHYPRPAISVARQPTVRHVPAHVLSKSYGASDLIRALQGFISTKDKSNPHLNVNGLLPTLPSDRFDVWHKATLSHSPLPFAPAQPCHRDVVRVQPPVRDRAGRVTKEGVFDMALFGVERNGFGLNRYRAGRVRAIFSLPPRLQAVHSGPLAFLDVFSSFEPDPTGTHSLYRTTPALLNGSRASIILPLGCLAVACHIAPDFSSPPSPVTVRQRLLFNEFYNYFVFLLMAHWRRMASAQPH